jgi:hypothetical protein
MDSVSDLPARIPTSLFLITFQQEEQETAAHCADIGPHFRPSTMQISDVVPKAFTRHRQNSKLRVAALDSRVRQTQRQNNNLYVQSRLHTPPRKRF